MKELHFQYKMKLMFKPAVQQHHFTLKCIPRTNERQFIRHLDMAVYPKEFLSTDEDSFGNYCIYGYAKGEHNHFAAQISGTARTGLSPWETAKESHQLGLFRHQSEYTEPGASIRAFADTFSFPKETSALDRSVALMHRLYENFSYVQGVTDIHTTAEEALTLGKGVCQDYSHILLSLCRLQGIPCRYVVGMLMGEGQSHAWTEICSDGRWYALDPTNNLIVDDLHIKISAGRDYHDCIVSQGVFVGFTTQTQDILVRVEDLPDHCGDNSHIQRTNL